MIAQYTLELRNGLPSLVTEKIHYISEKGYINSETVIQLLNDTLRLNRKAEEHVVMLALNTALDIIGIFPISHGSLNESHCRGREIFQRAFLVGANGMILAHNHPSGHLEPSKEDLARKEELQQLGKLMGIYLHTVKVYAKYSNENKREIYKYRGREQIEWNEPTCVREYEYEDYYNENYNEE